MLMRVSKRQGFTGRARRTRCFQRIHLGDSSHFPSCNDDYKSCAICVAANRLPASLTMHCREAPRKLSNVSARRGAVHDDREVHAVHTCRRVGNERQCFENNTECRRSSEHIHPSRVGVWHVIIYKPTHARMGVAFFDKTIFTINKQPSARESAY